MIEWLKKANNILCEMFTPSVVVFTPKCEERVKKPRLKLRWNVEKGKYDELITINLDKMIQRGWHPDTGLPIFVKSLAP